MAGERVELDDLLQLVAEERQPPGAVVKVRREHLDGVAAHPEGTARERLVVALVLQRDEVCQQLALGDALADLELEGHGGVGLHVADAVDARHRRHHDDVVALQQRPGGGVAYPVDLLVDRAFRPM